MQTVITKLTYDHTCEKLKNKFASLSETGIFFAIVSTEYDKSGNVSHDFLDVIDIATKAGYEYVNTIVYPKTQKQNVAFVDNVGYVVWLCKNHSIMQFDKDAIRERHIWKDVEWGKRAKNYNPKGKDPGNVFIPTKDDGKANITEHILLDDSGVIERLKLMSACGNDFELFEETVPLINLEPIPSECIHAKNIPCRAKVVFKTSENMYDVDNGCARLVVTSPPYWNLKDYFKDGQIGQESYSKYLCRMEAVWQQCYDKLSHNGTLWVNINIRVQNGKIVPIPRDFVKMCKKIGFYYKGILIWHKSSGIPTSDKNIVDRHEYVLVFSKQEKFFVNPKDFLSISDYKNDEINGGAFWNINRKAGSVGKKFIHPAIYPNGLVERIVLVASSVGDVVIDPFLGSGTSLIAAVQQHRAFIGYEYYEGFRKLMESRYSVEIPSQKIEYIYQS